MAEDVFACPRRVGEFGPWAHDAVVDAWRGDGTCSFCGSIRPGEFLRRALAGDEVVPTDKNYKAYVAPGHAKFYFQHLDERQEQDFVDLVNAKKVRFGYPGHFYVLPYFVRSGPAPKVSA